ncbi:hypothetical protein [Limnospira fusiformis]|uniref:hypothetical protein n=1 Tax=Limnospira fusiformis TaxID=54297 RepID=UPI00144955CE|nr:hypothetical protein HFV01_00840 [Limnospira fusiformis SAG 85.79]
MSSDELRSKLHRQNVRDEQDRKAWKETLRQVHALRARSNSYVGFREYYRWWLKNTREGREIKANLLNAQSEKCFKCGGSVIISREDGVSVDHSEIHHLAPLALLQRYLEAKPQIKWTDLSVLVTSEKYLRLVHSLCNKQLGEQVGDLPELQFLKDFLLENR